MYGYDTHGYRDPSVRAGDADREEVGERLRRHHAEGRLDSEEFQQRIDHCYQAKTIGELRQLVSDLPGEPERRTRRRTLWRLWPVPLIPILIAIWVIGLATGDHHHHFGFLWLIPLFFLLRFLIWPYGRRYNRRRLI